MIQDSVGFETSVEQEHLLAAGPFDTPVRNQLCSTLPAGTAASRVTAALHEVTARHEILRTTFVRAAGTVRPVQVVNAVAHVPVRAEERAHDDVGPLAVAAWSEPLDAVLGPVVRAAVSPGPSGDWLVLTAAAAVADLRSLQLVADEMRHLLTGGTTPEDEPLQFADYSSWQREQLAQGTENAEHPPLPAPWTRLGPSARPGQGSDGGRPGAAAIATTTIAEAMLRREAEGAGAGPGASWLAAWAVLASRLSGDETVRMGLVVEGRAGDEFVGAIGPYTRVLPLRIDVGPDMTFSDLVMQVAQARRSATAAIDSPTGERMTTPPAMQFEARGAGVGGWSGLYGGAEFRLVTSDEPTMAMLTWNPAVIDDAHGATVGRTLATLIDQIANRPTEPVARALGGHQTDLAWLDEVLTGPAQIEPHYPVHELFARQARRTPEGTALSSGDRIVTYAELDGWSSGLAHRLVDSGANQTNPVGILMERSVEQVVAILAALKAGAPHLCINPDQPDARIAFQVEHAGCPVLLVQADGKEVATPKGATRIVVGRSEGLRPDPPSVNVNLDDVAYIVYTSGSTGVPKGVAVTHRALVNYSTYIVDRLVGLCGCDPVLRFGVVSSLSTDLGNTCLYPPLISGGCTELFPIEIPLDAAAFAEYSARHPVDILKIAPSHLGALLAGGPDVLPRQVLVIGGEALSWDVVDRVRTLGGCRIINHYGPTETTVGSLTYSVDEGPAQHRSRLFVPIGRPIANTVVKVVDKDLHRLPPGAPGELMIGGTGVARGYWRDERQTAERFLADPGGATFYRTGDRVRCLPDGAMEFLGRLDGQVKVRGYRVETGEIEQNLLAHPQVLQAAVDLHPDDLGGGRLVAHVVVDRRAGISMSVLRDYLRDRLPDYMVPAAFHELDDLPLTASGKIDRQALSEFFGNEGTISDAYVPPSTEVEITLADIFADLLGVDRVGLHDDFFELGGHSLLATQAVAQARAAFKVVLPVHALFVEPTVAGLARAIDDQRRSSDDEDLSALLEELDGLTDEEAEALLAEEMGRDSAP